MTQPSPKPFGAFEWAGETVVCVAAGPSAKAADLEAAKGRARVIVINESWRLAPWADVLYACDAAWWRVRGPRPEEFAGVRLTQDVATAARLGIDRVSLVRGSDTLLTTTPGLLGWGGNGGFHALNLAVQAGASRIILVGYDFNGDHWHGRHPRGLNNPSGKQMARWATTIDKQAPLLAALGVSMVNTSLTSILKAFPKATLSEALA